MTVHNKCTRAPRYVTPGAHFAVSPGYDPHWDNHLPHLACLCTNTHMATLAGQGKRVQGNVRVVG